MFIKKPREEFCREFSLSAWYIRVPGLQLGIRRPLTARDIGQVCNDITLYTYDLTFRPLYVDVHAQDHAIDSYANLIGEAKTQEGRMPVATDRRSFVFFQTTDKKFILELGYGSVDPKMRSRKLDVIVSTPDIFSPPWAYLEKAARTPHEMQPGHYDEGEDPPEDRYRSLSTRQYTVTDLERFFGFASFLKHLHIDPKKEMRVE
jgi:hypothetical protein